MQIKSIKRIEEPVVVYNFSVEEDESYVLNGVISHNCRCALAPAMANLPDKPESNQADFDEWLNS
jgi:hypothetical protein